jgi:LacI family transcriptional regulator
MREIAELAGVSIGTVDRVIYKRGRVSPETKAKVEEVIERFQFSTNPLARSLKRRRPYRFCVCLPRRDEDAGYWAQLIAGIHSAEKMIAKLGADVEILEYDRYSHESFTDAARQVLEKRPDGLIFPPVMPDTTLPFIANVQAEGIPYIFVDSGIPGLKPLCTIAQDPWKSGYLAARLMRLFLAERGIDGTAQALVFDPHGEDYHIQKRREGFQCYAEKGGFTVTAREYAGIRGTELPEDEIVAILRELPHCNGIFVTNALVHRAASAVAHLLAEGVLHRSPAIIGYDLVPENRRLLAEGGVTAIISQRTAEQGRQALLSLYRAVVLEQEIAPVVEMPINVYFKESVPPPE